MKKLALLLKLMIFFSINTVFATQNTSIWKGVYKVKLDNGLQVILKKDDSHPVVTVQVWVKAGSVNENKKTYGLSHFLEHLIFKGSKNYPGDEISRRVETSGGNINAGTSKEFTQYYIDIPKNNYEDAIKILCDAMENASFPADEIEKERPVVLEEIYRHEDNPGSILYDMFSEAVFLKTPYKNRILGTEKVIKNVTRDEIIDYYKTFYVPNNMVFVVVGDIDLKKSEEIIKNTLGKMKKAELPKPPDLVEPQHKPLQKKQSKLVAQAYWVGGFIGPTIQQTKDQIIGDISSTIMGVGRSSRLFRIMREEKQIVYSISCSLWTQRGSSIMVYSSVFPPKNEKKVIKEIEKQIKILKKDGPTDEELKKVKEMLKSDWYFSKETFHGQGSMMGYWTLQENPGIIDTYIQILEGITKKDIISFFEKYHKYNKLNYAVLVPKKNKK